MARVNNGATTISETHCHESKIAFLGVTTVILWRRSSTSVRIAKYEGECLCRQGKKLIPRHHGLDLFLFFPFQSTKTGTKNCTKMCNTSNDARELVCLEFLAFGLCCLGICCEALFFVFRLSFEAYNGIDDLGIF